MNHSTVDSFLFVCFYLWCSSSSSLNKQTLCLHSYSGQDSVMDIAWGKVLQPLAWSGLSQRYMAFCKQQMSGLYCCFRFKRKPREKRQRKYCITKKNSFVFGYMSKLVFHSLSQRRGGSLGGTDLRPLPCHLPMHVFFFFFTNLLASFFAFIRWRIGVFCSNKWERKSCLPMKIEPISPLSLHFFDLLYVEEKKVIRPMKWEMSSGLDSQYALS